MTQESNPAGDSRDQDPSLGAGTVPWKTPYQVEKESSGVRSSIGHGKGDEHKDKDLLHGERYSGCGWQLAGQLVEHVATGAVAP